MSAFLYISVPVHHIFSGSKYIYPMRLLQ